MIFSSSLSSSIGYYRNGNISALTYNYLNLPKTVTKGSDVLTYIYDAAGVNKKIPQIKTRKPVNSIFFIIRILLL